MRCQFILFLLLFGCISVAFSQVPEMLEAGEYQQAIQHLESQIKSAPDTDSKALLLSEVAKIHFDYLHDYATAIKTYKKILKLQRKGLSKADHLLAQFQMAKAHARLGQHDEAIKIYEEIKRTNPATELSYQMAQRFIHTTRSALQKLKTQQQWIQRNQDTPLAVEMQLQIAEILLKELNQPEAAIERYRSIVRDHPDSALAIDAQWRIGNTYHKVLHQKSEAFRAYQRLIEQYSPSPYAAEAEYQIGHLHTSAGDFEQAVLAFEHLIATYPSFWRLPAAYYWLADSYERGGDYKRAIDALTVFLRVYLPAADPSFLGDIGRYGESKLEVQADLEERIRTLEARLPRTLLEKATEYLQQKDYLAALENFRTLIALAPQTEYAQKARERLEEIAYRAELQRLEAQLKEYRQSRNSISGILYRMAEIHERYLDESTEAISIYKKIMDMGKPSWSARAAYRIGVLYAQQPLQQQALLAYQHVIDDYPQSSEAMMANYEIGEIYRSQQKYQQALDAYRNTIDYPEREWYLGEGTSYSLAERSRFSIGRIYYENLQNYGEAFQTFQEFIETYPNSPRLAASYVMIGLIQEIRQNIKDALTAYAKARDLAFGSEIQANYVADEITSLDFPGRDPLSVGKRLQKKISDLSDSQRVGE